MNYTKAVFIREFEMLLLDLFGKGRLNGTVHTCVGQETIPLALAEYTVDGDRIFSNHRGHGHFLAFGGDTKALLAEMLGKKSGVSGGIGGSQHLYNENFISNGIQAGLTPAAVGYAKVNALKKNDNIAVVFVGDGTLGEGLLYESLNLASIYQAPVLFVMENNGYAQSTPFALMYKGNIKDRINGFGIQYLSTTIWDESFEEIVKEAVNLTRTGQPVFVEIECYRLNPHSKGDDNRDEKEIALFRQKDPINQFKLNNPNLAEQVEREAVDVLQRILKELDEEATLKSVQQHQYVYSQRVEWEAVQRIESDRINKLIYEGLKLYLSKENTIFLGEDIANTTSQTPGEYGGAFKVSGDLSDLYEGRVLNTPIAEASIIGFAVGAALNGYRPVVEIMFGDFLSLGFDQILQQVSKIPEMYGRKINLPLIIRTPMGGRRGYGPTHSQNIEKHFLFLPNIRMIALNSYINPIDIYKSLINNDYMPTIVIEDKIGYTKKLCEIEIRGYKVMRSSEDFPTLFFKPTGITANLTILCYGGMLDEVLMAMSELLEEEAYPHIICPLEISPFNIYPLLESIRVTKRLFIIEEGSRYGALSAEIMSYLLVNKIEIEKVSRFSNESIIPCAKEAEINVIPNRTTIVSNVLNFLYD